MSINLTFRSNKILSTIAEIPGSFLGISVRNKLLVFTSTALSTPILLNVKSHIININTIDYPPVYKPYNMLMIL